MTSSPNCLSKNSKYPVSCLDFTVNFSIPISEKTSTEALIPAIERIGGFLNSHPSAPGSWSNSSRILNRVSLLWLHQPVNRLRSFLLAWRSCTKQPPRLPGPEFKYLYVHHTAKSAPESCKFNSTFPAPWAQSNPTMQPCL